MITPRVTVLMPVYNCECYLKDAMDSILGQTFTDFQFLIINDGSTDNSVCIIQSYEDPRICLVHNNRNLGLSVSLNRGLELAKGTYIARMDADDISRPERLACQVNFMDSHPDVGVCGSWVQFFPKTGKCVWKLPESSEEIRCRQFYTVGVAHPSVMMRKELFLENGLFYNSGVRFSQDYELWGRAIQYVKFANIQKVLLDYRISSEQICSKHGSEQLSTIAPIRLQRVRELGIEPTLFELELHMMVINNAMPHDSGCLDRAEQWLLRLEASNRASGTYLADCFSRMLLDIWFSVCLNLSGVSLCSCWRCIASPLWTTTNNSSYRRLRALGAWAVRLG